MKIFKIFDLHVWYIPLCIGIVVLLSEGCEKKTDEPEKPPLLGNESIGTVYDYDYNAYKLIAIGAQGWLRENAKAVHYSTGETIPQIKGNSEWDNTSQGAWCDCRNDSLNAKVYGHLYNWHAAHDTRNLCPKGFHVPTNDEWNKLIDYLGGWEVAGGTMKEAGTDHWDSPNYGAYNGSGFAALAAGCRVPNSFPSDYYYLKVYGYFWTASTSRYDPTEGVYQQLDHQSVMVWPLTEDKGMGFSARCV